MNDSMSILLATTILAMGGFGLYMYKDSHNSEDVEKDNYNEDSLFGANFWGGSEEITTKSDSEDEEYNNEDDEIKRDYKPRKKTVKTQKNKKTIGTSRRRY